MSKFIFDFNIISSWTVYQLLKLCAYFLKTKCRRTLVCEIKISRPGDSGIIFQKTEPLKCRTLNKQLSIITLKISFLFLFRRKLKFRLKKLFLLGKTTMLGAFCGKCRKKAELKLCSWFFNFSHSWRTWCQRPWLSNKWFSFQIWAIEKIGRNLMRLDFLDSIPFLKMKWTIFL